MKNEVKVGKKKTCYLQEPNMRVLDLSLNGGATGGRAGSDVPMLELLIVREFDNFKLPGGLIFPFTHALSERSQTLTF